MKIPIRIAFAITVVLAIGLGSGVAVLGRSSSGAGVPAGGVGTTARSPVPSSSMTPPSAQSLLGAAGGTKYLGVALPAGAAGLAGFQAATDTAPNLNEIYLDLGRPFPVGSAELALAQGAYTLIAWQSGSLPLAGIAAGDQDGYLTAFARAVKAYAWPVLLDFDHEFNGDWYPWGTQAVTPGQFVAAWRHIHAVFSAVGAANALWVWSPNVVNPVPRVGLAAYWPGPQFVDVVGIVGYYTGQLGEDSYAGLFGRTEKVIDAFARKPYLITEAGAEQGPDKAAWITDLLRGVTADPRMLGLIYFDEGRAQHKREDWTLQDDPGALAAWRAGASPIPQRAVSAS